MSWEKCVQRGTLALARFDYATAEEAFEQALQTAQREFGEGDERLLQTLSLLGQTHYRLGHHDKAKTYLSRSTSSSTKQESDSLRIAVDCLSLAEIDSQLGETMEEKAHFRKALSVLQTAKPLQFEYSFEATSELEKLFRAASKRETERASESFRDLLLTAQKNHAAKPRAQEYFGTEPSSIVDAWQNLMESGTTCAKNDDSTSIVTAFQNLNSALRIATAMFPADHQHIADSLSSLAIVAAKLGLCDDADQLFREACRIFKKSGTDPLKVAMLKMHMAGFYSTQFDYPAAVAAICDAAELVGQLDDLTETKFVDLSELFFTLMQKAELHRNVRRIIRKAIELEESENLEQAEFLYGNSVALLQRIFGESHLEIAQIMRFQSNALQKMGRSDEAEETRASAEKIESDARERAAQLERLRANLPAVRY